MTSETSEDETSPEDGLALLVFNTPNGKDVAVFEWDILTIWASPSEDHTILELSSGELEVVYPFNDLINLMFDHTDLRKDDGTAGQGSETSSKADGVAILRSVAD